MNNLSYLLAPFVAWLVAGVLKFLVNSLKARHLAFNLIGYGGLPSNHSAIVSSMVTLIGLKEGVQSPIFGVAITLAFIVILDASSLRRQVGKQASAINKLNSLEMKDAPYLRERMGHTSNEILVGILVGVGVGTILARF